MTLLLGHGYHLEDRRILKATNELPGCSVFEYNIFEQLNHLIKIMRYYQMVQNVSCRGSCYKYQQFVFT